MEPKIKQIQKYSVTYLNEEEIKILNKEIFQNEIYSIDILNDSPIIFDVGAHIGMATIYFKDRYPKSSVYSFEPNPNIFPVLEENVEMNGIKDVKLFNIALGLKEGIRDMYIDSSGLCAFSTSSFRKDAWNGKQKSLPISVKIDILSKYINMDIDLMKIDVEGSELDIIMDLDNNNLFSNIKNMIIEYHPKKNQKIEKILHILRKNNFELSFKEEGKAIDMPKEELILIIAKKRV